MCITFVQRLTNVFDVGPALHECYTNVLCWLELQQSRRIPTMADEDDTRFTASCELHLRPVTANEALFINHLALVSLGSVFACYWTGWTSVSGCQEVMIGTLVTRTRVSPLRRARSPFYRYNLFQKQLNFDKLTLTANTIYVMKLGQFWIIIIYNFLWFPNTSCRESLA